MDLRKSIEYFNPTNITEPIHIIGCGAVGSTFAMLFARAGLTNIHLYDFDTVEEKNIVNQLYTAKYIGQPKTKALSDLLMEINPEIGSTLITHGAWEKGTYLSGYVFLAVDNIDTRRSIVEDNRYNVNVKTFFDTRLTLNTFTNFAYHRTDAQTLLKTMNFSQNEAQTERSACGEELGTYATVMLACAYQFANFRNLIYKNELVQFKTNSLT